MELRTTKTEAIRQLQNQILAMQGLSRPAEAETIRTGLSGIERAFPNQTFPTGAVHEFTSVASIDGAATNGFLAGLLGCLMQSKGTCLWVSTRRKVFPPALKAFGIAPERIIFIDIARDKEALWTIEEALKCKSLAAVVGELSSLDFTASRRLQLAVEHSRVTGFIHRQQPKTENNIACVSRWKITPLLSWQQDAAPGVGFPRWNVELVKVRNGQPGIWQVEWTTTGFREVPRFSHSVAGTVIRKTG